MLLFSAKFHSISNKFSSKQAMEKWMIVYLLPLEVWMDIFCFPWITRRDFGQIVDKIGNFKFAEHAQFYLHEWGKRTMGTLILTLPYLDVPQTPVPTNIKYLRTIKIEFVTFFEFKLKLTFIF